MTRGAATTCPHCGSRVKSGWEICPRCNESIELADTLVDQDFDEFLDEPPPPDETREVQRQDIGFSGRTWLSTAALLAGSIVAFVMLRDGPGARADPNLF